MDKILYRNSSKSEVPDHYTKSTIHVHCTIQVMYYLLPNSISVRGMLTVLPAQFHNYIHVNNFTNLTLYLKLMKRVLAYIYNADWLTCVKRPLYIKLM